MNRDGAGERSRERLFFALWPEETLRARLEPWRELKRDCGGKAVPTANLHITLAFLGGVDGDTRDCLEQGATAITVPSFTLELDQLGYWRRPQVVWLGASQTPDQLISLVQQLGRLQAACGLEPESRPFAAHLTLLRKARRAPEVQPREALVWPVAEFVLVRSLTLPGGAQYEVLRRWPLR